MKRSEINNAIRMAEEFFARHHFQLPPFARYTLNDWKEKSDALSEVRDCALGWDVTDFGSGEFNKTGLLLFTLRNGVLNNPAYPKSYAEKIMISRSCQVTVMHCHEYKQEDIINRGGGKLVFELYNRGNSARELADTPVKVVKDGMLITVKAGERIAISPGESLTLTPGLFHTFYADEGNDVLIGEVSAVNDDYTDNCFYRDLPRFPETEEDEAIYRVIVSDYRTIGNTLKQPDKTV